MGTIDDVVILASKGRGDYEYAENVSRILGAKLGKVDSRNHEDGEPYFRIIVEEQEVAGKDVFFIKRYHGETDGLMELINFANAAHNASARTVNIIETYCSSSRQERITRPGEALTMQAKALAILAQGPDTYSTFAIHAEAIQGFFPPHTTKFRSFPLWPLFIRVVHKLTGPNDSVKQTAPDAGAAKTSEEVLHCSTIKDDPRYDRNIAIIHKDRVHTEGGESDSKYLVGKVERKIVCIIDDETNSAGTIYQGAKLCKDNGAIQVIGAISHGKYGGERRGIATIRKAFDEEVLDFYLSTNTAEEFPELQELKEDPRYKDRVVIIPTEPLVAHAISANVLHDPYNKLYSSKGVVSPYNQIDESVRRIEEDSRERARFEKELLFRNAMVEAVLGPYHSPLK